MTLRWSQSTFIVVSLLAHAIVFVSFRTAAARAPRQPARRVELALYRPPPPPVETPAPPKPMEVEKKVLAVKPVAPPRNAPVNEPPPPPMFGLSLSSVGKGNSGFDVRVGNTTMTEPVPGPPPQDVRPLPGDGGTAPVSITKVNKMPVPVGDCPHGDPRKLYTAAAREQNVEGRVVLEVVVGRDGRVSDVRVVEGLGYGLDEAAAKAVLEECRYEPAEMGGEKVATKIRVPVTFVNED